MDADADLGRNPVSKHHIQPEYGEEQADAGRDCRTRLARNPVSKHHIQPEYGEEQADAGRDCRTRLARPNSQARTMRTGKYSFPLFS